MSAVSLFTPSPEHTTKPLRPHQEHGITLVKRSLLAGSSRIVLQMPTGAGKTRTAAEIIKGARAKGNRVAFVVPAISLIDQTVEAFIAEGIREIGVMQGSHELTHYGMPVQVCSVQTLAARGTPEVEVVIVDECHVQFKVTIADKQLFWSMAQWIDMSRSKGGRLAKALYKGKFGVWPRGLSDTPTEPDLAFYAYERSRRIAFAKSKGRP